MNGVYLLFFLTIYVEGQVNLPTFWKPCYRNVPCLSGCIQENIENLQTLFSNGPIPALGLPSLFPAIIPKHVYNQSGLYYVVSNYKIWHLDNYTVDSVDASTEHFNIDLFYPLLAVEFQYIMKGKLLALELDAHGDASEDLIIVPVNYRTSLGTITKNGTQYLTVKSSKIKLNIGKYFVNMINLFKDPVLNKIGNKVLNYNQDILIKQFIPFVGEILKPIFDNSIKYVLATYPLDVLLPNKK